MQSNKRVVIQNKTAVLQREQVQLVAAQQELERLLQKVIETSNQLKVEELQIQAAIVGNAIKDMDKKKKVEPTTPLEVNEQKIDLRLHAPFNGEEEDDD